ncbi:Aluminum-activated malate transporter 2 [Acorus gramineus]|uniref:Aluminum-activated malate transporter 2 n=1 Tax=Acorus gramineus TaxID=55184 RepID=A0AAV9BE84_ACOGR|nr:Aluminum-activated malate transporter 2 [Acorus gramineus]
MSSMEVEQMSHPERVFDATKACIVRVLKKTKKLSKDDPRRVIHSLKVGLALTLVSLLYYIRPVYDGFGVATMWAVLTVIVVMEYSVGATIGKGLNRAFATLLGGSLGIGAHQIAELLGEKGEPVFLGVSVFLLASGATFSRFFPRIKARYDYGVTIFILSFSLVSMSSYRIEDIVELGHQRLSTVAIGVAVCLCVSMFICPVWAGGELQELIALNIEKLAAFLEGLSTLYFAENDGGGDVSKEKKNLLFQGYKSVLNSKSTEDALANFARWEPGHGRFQFKHPWNQYLKIGTLTRQCACHIEALHSVLNSDNQALLDIDDNTRLVLYNLSSESGKALSELASSIRSMTIPTVVTSFASDALGATIALDGLKVATVASLLIEIAACVERVTGSVGELAQKANFSTATAHGAMHGASVNPDPTEAAEVVVVLTVVD